MEASMKGWEIYMDTAEAST